MITKKLYHSFKFALCGLLYCIKNERNFRLHIVAAATVFLIAPYYSFSVAQMALITIVIAMVLICEVFNTAIEVMIDLEIKKYNLIAKRAKDISAGAVFIAALCAVICGLYLFAKIDIIHSIMLDITSSPVKIAAVIIYLAISYVFIRCFSDKGGCVNN